MLQIYFDFSGYSDMAIGLGRMFGFETPENFRYPYAAASLTEFWRRWHISLSSWFRDYLYIPLGGNRKGRLRAAGNKLIVFVLCGAWHGAGWTYLVWGAWHGLLCAAESLLGVKRVPEKGLRRVLGHVWTLLAVCVGFVFFRAETLAGGLQVLRGMLGLVPVSAASTAALYAAVPPLTAALLCVGAVCALPVRTLFTGFLETRTGRALSYVASAALLVLCVMRLAAGGFAPFIYFQF
jgi:alginate O-acetyltransferase complex protein AlgI